MRFSLVWKSACFTMVVPGIDRASAVRNWGRPWPVLAGRRSIFPVRKAASWAEASPTM